MGARFLADSMDVVVVLMLNSSYVKRISVDKLRIVQILFIVFCLTSALTIKGLRVSKAADSPRTWIVDDNGPADFSKIQDAVFNDSVQVGDTIFVHNGTYRENILINKSLNFVGENVETTKIYGTLGISYVVSVEAANVTFMGFTVGNASSFPTAGSAILLQHVSGCVISHNNLTESSNGIYLNLSNGNSLSNNFIAPNGYYGIYIRVSSGNTISGNDISSSFCGIYFFLGGGNTIYHNNFENYGSQVLESSGNFWDYDGEGNYWVNYTGVDLNGDGIGDSPYNVVGDEQDYYPLMGPFSNFRITSAGETYGISVISNSTIQNLVFEIGPETGNKILRFDAIGDNTTIGFCRISIPTALMQYPYIVLVGGEEVVPTLIGTTNGTSIRLYFAYPQKDNTIRIISSYALHLYTELLANFTRLQTNYFNLNSSYFQLLITYDELLANCVELQESIAALNDSVQQLSDLNASYSALLDSDARLQAGFDSLNANYTQLVGNHSSLWLSFYNLDSMYSSLSSSYANLQTLTGYLNTSYYDLLSSHNVLSQNYTHLQGSYDDLYKAYQQHLLDDSEQLQNIRNLIYIIVSITTVFLITIIYLSMRIHRSGISKTITIEDKEHERQTR